MSERGSGLLGTLFGVAAVIVAIGFCANVCLGLWTRSTVEAVAQDAARDLAATPAGELDAARVETVLSRARARLGPTGAETDLRLERLDDRVAVRVRHPGVSLMPRLVAGPSVGALDELVVVGREDQP
ncbi:hypothetical protein [Dermatobacter hominis]|uniref:hypothetical protein n=1 Tax=Dermatobacter hominis TaxID=2884263 RepID=UPI001D12B7D4|nr:hypothetical protein [Dermatobacter hominis]UDY35792.1 hypothetical protein LH044_21015 [Dermatobacter hominis]